MSVLVTALWFLPEDSPTRIISALPCDGENPYIGNSGNGSLLAAGRSNEKPQPKRMGCEETLKRDFSSKVVMTGFVFDAITEKPLPGAVVRFYNSSPLWNEDFAWLEIETDSDGKYMLAGFENMKSYRLQFQRKGYAVASIGVNIPEKKPIMVLGNISLLRGINVIARVATEAGATPDGIVFYVYREMEESPIWIRDSKEIYRGIFSFNIPYDEYERITAVLPDHVPESADEFSPENGVIELRFTMKRGKEFAGTVVNDRNMPVSGASVYIINPFIPGMWIRTGPEGRFSSGACFVDDEYVIQVEAEKHYGASLEDVEPGKEDLNIVTPRLLTVKTIVKNDETGEGIPGASVRIEYHMPDGNRSVTRAGTVGDGTCSRTVPITTRALYFNVDHVAFHDVEDYTVPISGDTDDHITVPIRMDPRKSIIGYVRDAATGEPIENASIVVSRRDGRDTWDCMSRSDGSYGTPYISSGAANVYFKHPDYRVRTIKQFRIRRYARTINVDLERGRSMRVTVKSEEGEPVSSMVIVCSPAECADLAPMEIHYMSLAEKTDNEGICRFRALEPNRRYDLVAVGDEQYWSANWQLSIPLAGIPAPAPELVLRRSAALSGTIKTTAGKPVTEAEVMIEITEQYKDLDGSLKHIFQNEDCKTNELGCFFFRHLPPGACTIKVIKQGYIPYTYGSIALAPGRHLDNLNLILDSGKSVSGVVVDPDENPISGVQVKAIQPGSGSYTQQRNTGDSGAFTFTGYHDGNVSITIEISGYSGDTTQVVQAGDMSVAFRMAKNGEILGKIVGALPENYMRVTVSSDNYSTSDSFENLENGEFTVSVPPGEYNVEIASLGFVGAQAANVIVLSDEQTRVEIPVKKGCRVKARVTNGENLAAFSSAWVSLKPIRKSDADTHPWYEYWNAYWDANSEGVVDLDGIPEGTYVIKAYESSNGWATIDGIITVTSDITQEIDVVLNRGGYIEASVTDPEGSLLNGALVAAVDSEYVGSPELSQTLTETSITDEGKCSVGPLEPGYYEVTVSFKDYTTVVQNVWVYKNDKTPCAFVLEKVNNPAPSPETEKVEPEPEPENEEPEFDPELEPEDDEPEPDDEPDEELEREW
jgi:hypothetical protein